jgi:hypothetical protein
VRVAVESRVMDEGQSQLILLHSHVRVRSSVLQLAFPLAYLDVIVIAISQIFYLPCRIYCDGIIKLPIIHGRSIIEAGPKLIAVSIKMPHFPHLFLKSSVDGWEQCHAIL